MGSREESENFACFSHAAADRPGLRTAGHGYAHTHGGDRHSHRVPSYTHRDPNHAYAAPAGGELPPDRLLPHARPQQRLGDDCHERPAHGRRRGHLVRRHPARASASVGYGAAPFYVSASTAWVVDRGIRTSPPARSTIRSTEAQTGARYRSPSPCGDLQFSRRQQRLGSSRPGSRGRIRGRGRLQYDRRRVPTGRVSTSTTPPCPVSGSSHPAGRPEIRHDLPGRQPRLGERSEPVNDSVYLFASTDGGHAWAHRTWPSRPVTAAPRTTADRPALLRDHGRGTAGGHVRN